MRVVALAAGSNVERLADQIAAHLPEVVSVENEDNGARVCAHCCLREMSICRASCLEKQDSSKLRHMVRLIVWCQRQLVQ